MQVFKTLAELLWAIPALQAGEWIYVNLTRGATPGAGRVLFHFGNVSGGTGR